MKIRLLLLTEGGAPLAILMRAATLTVLAVPVLLACVLAITSNALAQDTIFPGETMKFDSPDGSIESTECPPLIICNSSADVPGGEAHTNTIAILAMENKGKAVSSLFKTITVESMTSEETVLDAQVTGSIAWRGTLISIIPEAVFGVQASHIGTKAEAFIRVSLIDVTSTDSDEHFEVGNAAIADFICANESGGIGASLGDLGATFNAIRCEEDDSDTFSFNAKVITGHTYELQMTSVCKIAVGGVNPSQVTLCTFNPVSIDYNFDDFDPVVQGLLGAILPQVDDGFVKWDYFTLTIDEDVLGAIADAKTMNLDAVADAEETILDAVDDAKTMNLDAVADAEEAILDAVANAEETILNAVADANAMSIDAVDDAKTMILDAVDDAKTMILEAVTDAEVMILGAVEVVRGGAAEIIRLLHTPQGKRETEIISGFDDLCGDGDCDWPEK